MTRDILAIVLTVQSLSAQKCQSRTGWSIGTRASKERKARDLSIPSTTLRHVILVWWTDFGSFKPSLYSLSFYKLHLRCILAQERRLETADESYTQVSAITFTLRKWSTVQSEKQAPCAQPSSTQCEPVVSKFRVLKWNGHNEEDKCNAMFMSMSALSLHFKLRYVKPNKPGSRRWESVPALAKHTQKSKVWQNPIWSARGRMKKKKNADQELKNI